MAATINAMSNMSTRKTKTAAKAAESAAELARSPETTESPSLLDRAFNSAGSSFQKEMAGMKEVLKTNSYLNDALAEHLSLDEKFSLVISEMYRLKKAQEAAERKYDALLLRFQTHEDEIRQNGDSQEDTFQELVGRTTSNESNIVNIHAENQGINSQLGSINDQIELMSRDMNLLKGFSDKFEKQFDLLKAKAVTDTTRSMNKNLIFSGIAESKKENCKATIESFLKQVLKISF